MESEAIIMGNTKKQNILIVHNYYQIPGGEDSVVHNEQRMLETHGHKVMLYTRDNSEIKQFSKYEKIMLPFEFIFNIKTYRDIKKIIKENNIDVVHVHNTLSLISNAVYYAAINCGVPVVQTIHNFRLLCPGATFYRDGKICERCIKGGLKNAIKYNCYRNSKIQTMVCVLNIKIHRMLGVYKKINYICLTEFNKNKLLSFNQISPNRVYVKPNFEKKHDDSVICNERDNQFIFVGRLDKTKGIVELLRAWEKLDNKTIKLIICGTGPMEEWCRQFLNEHKCNVEMMGFVNKDTVINILARSKALILPTKLYEGFPMTIVEAFSMGTPVICSNIGNSGAIVEESINGYKFNDFSPKSIIDCVNKIENNPLSYDVIYKIFKEKYSEKSNYIMLNDIYEKII